MCACVSVSDFVSSVYGCARRRRKIFGVRRAELAHWDETSTAERTVSTRPE